MSRNWDGVLPRFDQRSRVSYVPDKEPSRSCAMARSGTVCDIVSDSFSSFITSSIVIPLLDVLWPHWNARSVPLQCTEHSSTIMLSLKTLADGVYDDDDTVALAEMGLQINGNTHGPTLEVFGTGSRTGERV